MTATAHDATTLEYRNKVRYIARLACAAGHDAMRKNFHVIRAAQHFNKFYKIDFFEPYKYQLKWFRSGQHFRLRYLSAANRIGKTYCGAAEFSYHATGNYPAWWQGYITPTTCIGGDRIMWAVGVSAESTRKVLQKELLGTDDARQKHLFGSGSIPRELINFDSFVCDGETVKSFRVFHASGEECAVHFYSATQDQGVLMGQAIVFAWVDEQSEKEDILVGQCTTRTTTTRGIVAITATPEVGATDLYNRCHDDTTGKVFFQNAVWDDAPHLTEDDKADMLAVTPYFQREMRSKGIPIIGVGAVYPYEESHITCAPFPIPDHWQVIAACDFGYTGISDPSVIVFVAYDRETGNRYVFQEWGSPDDRDDLRYANSHMPHYMAGKLVGKAPRDWKQQTGTDESAFSGLGLPSVSVMLPGDGDGVQSGTQKTRGELMRNAGANICHDTFLIPEDMAPLENNRRSLIGSISICSQLFQDGNLKIFNTCTELLRELRLYQWKKKGLRTIPADKDNHYLDAMRYGAICVRDYGVMMFEARKNPGTGVYEINNPFEEDMGAYEL